MVAIKCFFCTTGQQPLYMYVAHATFQGSTQNIKLGIERGRGKVGHVGIQGARDMKVVVKIVVKIYCF